MDEIIVEFLTESLEGLDQLDNKFVMLEQNPDDRDTLASIFRTVHTIKGTCGFLGFGHLEKLAHAGENLLSLLRDGKLNFTQEIASALLTMLDAVRTMLGEIERTEADGEESYANLIETLNRLKEGGSATPASRPESEPALPASPPPAPEPAHVPPVVHESSAAEAENAGASHAGSERLPPGAVFFLEPPPAPEAPSSASSATQQPEPTTTPQTPVEPDAKPVAQPATQARTALTPAPERAAPIPAPASGGPGIAESSIRVDVPLLDKLMNLVGELVLARNQIVEYTLLQENPQLIAASQRLNLITSELQEGIMRTRMQPISNIWAKFPRIVRDLAVSCGKQVHVEMEGKETELDKSLIEAMKDPLTHLIRNAVDHGIELPAVRHASGKSEEGCLLLRAYHEGGQVHIEIADNGAGINPIKLRNKALEKGLITLERADAMSDQDLRRLIFLAGFSTAEKITNISGRGVGMDVVKTNIENIGGLIDLESELGQGTTFKIRIPLTLAIVPALIVTSGGERFAIPQVNLLELIRVTEEQR
ncbi:MAG: chemotaxis protein CheA, partial [Candidatus Competibacteraceae bacterium]|nr:chemotaxis protein CheA [Candidatus Competibacteraceae bacterium]